MRVAIGDNFDVDLFELQRLATHQVGTQSDRAVVDHGDREQRLGLVPAGIGNDVAGRAQIVCARLVMEARMPVPVAHVVRAEAGVQVVEEDLLPARVGAEVNCTLLGAWPCGDRERDDV